jgi:hypothetical protein
LRAILPPGLALSILLLVSSPPDEFLARNGRPRGGPRPSARCRRRCPDPGWENQRRGPEPRSQGARPDASIRCRGDGRLPRFDRSPRPFARTGTIRQGNHRQRHGGRRPRRVCLGGLHAQHFSGHRQCRHCRPHPRTRAAGEQD